METEVEKLPKKTIKLKITVPKSKVKEAHEKIIDEAVKGVEIDGFRKGKAPRKLAEEKIDQEKIKEKTLNRLLTDAYLQAIKELLLKPITEPRIELKKFNLEEDLIFTAAVAEKPEVEVGDYRQVLKELGNKKLKTKNQKVVYGPSGEPIKKVEGNKEEEKITTNAVISAVLSVCKVEIPDLLTDAEVNRLLARLVDQTSRLGLTVEQYLSSQGKTAEQLRNEYRKTAEETLKAEFTLYKLAELEKVKVEEREISDTIKAAPEEKSREALSKPEGRLYVESILLKSRTISRLVEVAEGKSL